MVIMVLSYKPSISLHVQTYARDLQYLIRILTGFVIQNTALYKLHAAARLPIDLNTFTWVKRVINV